MTNFTVEVPQSVIDEITNTVLARLNGAQSQVAPGAPVVPALPVPPAPALPTDPWAPGAPTGTPQAVQAPVVPVPPAPVAPIQQNTGPRTVQNQTPLGLQTWTFMAQGAPNCKCPPGNIPSAYVTGMGKNSREYKAWRCSKRGPGGDYKTACDYNEWTG
jgi:hypothetical protein